MKKLNRSLATFGLLCSLLLFALVFPSSVMANYTITEQELDQLEYNLNQLETLNKKSQTDLATVRKKLENSERKSQALTEELSKLKATSEMQQESLRIANESLQRFAKEIKRNERRIKRQRAIYVTLLVGGVVYAASHR